MSFLAAAVVGGAVIGAGSTYFSTKNAAEAQTHAADTATNAQLQMFRQTQERSAPFVGAGAAALPQAAAWNDPSNPQSPLHALMQLLSPGGDPSYISKLPGYQFAQKASNNALAARGLAGSGGPVALGSSAAANTTFDTTIQNLLKAFTAGGGSLQNLATMGANTATGLGTQGVQTGQQIGSNAIGAGNAIAGANIATGNAIGGVGNSLSTAMMLRQLSGGGGGIYGSTAGSTGSVPVGDYQMPTVGYNAYG